MEGEGGGGKAFRELLKRSAGRLHPHAANTHRSATKSALVKIIKKTYKNLGKNQGSLVEAKSSGRGRNMHS